MANPQFSTRFGITVNGATARINFNYYRTDGQTFTYQDSTFPDPVLTVNGVQYVDSGFGSAVRGAGVRIGDVWCTERSITFSQSGTYPVKWTAGSGQRSDFAGEWTSSVTVTVPTTYIEPNVGLSNLTATKNTISGVVDVSNWGVPSYNSYSEISVSSTGSSEYRRMQKVRSPLDIQPITVTNDSEDIGGSYIIPNTRYYCWAYASNGQVGQRENTEGVTEHSVVTLPDTLTDCSASWLTDTSATVHYSIPADGGFYQRHVEYSISKVGWPSGFITTDGNAHSGTFTVSEGISKTGNNKIYLRVETVAGASEIREVIVGGNKAPVFYGSDDGETAPVNKFYGSVNGKTTKIKKLYGSMDGVTKLVGLWKY